MSDAVLEAVPDRFRLISVVICPNGYQAMIEETINISMHPYTATVTRIARAASPVAAIRAAIHGKQKRNVG